VTEEPSRRMYIPQLSDEVNRKYPIVVVVRVINEVNEKEEKLVEV